MRRDSATEIPVTFTWEVSSFFGWGIYGLNMLLHWPGPAFSARLPGEVWLHDRRQQRRIETALAQSRALCEKLETVAGGAATLPMPVLHGLGNGLALRAVEHGVTLQGTPDIAVVFLEDAFVPPAQRDHLKAMPLIVAGSRWNADLISAAGLSAVRTVLQGVDVERFRPQPKARRDGLFRIFSGGKLEVRKGQDLVLLAFRAFATRHPEARLVTAWHTLWPHISEKFSLIPGVGAPPRRQDGFADIPAWAARMGIASAQLHDVGAIPNSEFPRILGDVDVAVFPNRCEGGTNLVAMECLAAGVPTILSANSGHLDLIERTETFALTRQRPLAIKAPDVVDASGWRDSDVEEIVEILEQVYRERDTARLRALRAAKAMASLSWKRQIDMLHREVRSRLQ
ncbi:MAG TPA: glycosyltransferase [Stellaceae bacterium]|nr:glycosyltransferase [Stellaceae bacterium]